MELARDSEEMQDKELTYELLVRVWGQTHDVVHSHGYLVDDVPTGLSGPVGVLHVNAQKISFRQLRPMIEYAQDCGHMKKRNLIFQEALFYFNRMPNLYDRPFGDLQKYRLGFVKKDGSDVKMFKRAQDDTPVVQLLGLTEYFGHDLVIIPWSQIPLDMNEPAEEEVKATEKPEPEPDPEAEMGMGVGAEQKMATDADSKMPSGSDSD